MRIVVHDYAGHPFQVQLARELARRGHSTLHLHSASFQTPKGATAIRPGDPASLLIEGLRLDTPFRKYGNFVLRRRQEIAYGRIAARRISAFQPDAVISANTPLDAQVIVQRAAKRTRARFTFWLQDIYSDAIGRYASGLAGAWYRRIERRLLRESDAVVPVCRAFAGRLSEWGVPTSRIHVAENWAPFDELPVVDQENDWAREHGLAGKVVFLYAGTLGLKHDPRRIAELALAARAWPDAAVVVASEGPGADWLRTQPNVRVLPFQAWERMPEVLGSASVLVALLDEAAGSFSVPSKVLSYLCAARPVLAAVPKENPVAAIIRDHAAGIVVTPSDTGALVAAASRLYSNQRLRFQFGYNARRYARKYFDITSIGDRFEAILAEGSAWRARIAAAS